MSTFAITLLFALLVASMTAAATAVRSVSRIWLRHWAERQIAGATTDQAAPALRKPHEYLLAAGTGIAAAVFSLGALIAYREDRAELMRDLVVATLALLLVGQVIPRAIARHWATALVPVLAPLLRVLDALFGPLLGFAARLVRPLVAKALLADPPAPSDPLEDLLREAELEGIGEPAESEIISGVVEFGEKRVKDVMTPRARVTAVSREMGDVAVAESVAKSNYTRIPVFGASDREVVGVVHAFDVLEHPDRPLATLRAAATATVDEPCGVVMRRMLREHRHLAIVRGGDGGVAGIVTLEDLVEELVGDIRDEHDDPAATA
jgi:putative hemolysin